MKVLFNKLSEMLNVEIRNVKIATLYSAMSLQTSMKYREKIKILADEYHLSEKSIERIVKDYQD